MLTVDQRVRFVKFVWRQFQTVHRVHRECSSSEYELARRWALRGVPLATVLQGINETTAKPRTLMACERAVEENIGRWAQSHRQQTELPKPGPLEPFDVEAARERRDEALAKMHGGER